MIDNKESPQTNCQDKSSSSKLSSKALKQLKCVARTSTLYMHTGNTMGKNLQKIPQGQSQSDFRSKQVMSDSLGVPQAQCLPTK